MLDATTAEPLLAHERVDDEDDGAGGFPQNSRIAPRPKPIDCVLSCEGLPCRVLLSAFALMRR